MNISKFVDFYLVTGHSKKNDKDWYGISLRINDKDFILTFINKDAFDLISSKLN